MTLVDDRTTGADAYGGSARISVTPQQAWDAARAPVLLTLLVVVTGIVVALLTGNPGLGPMYPDSARPEGARALATLLRERGVTVERTPAFSGRGGQTVFVPIPDLVDPDDLGNVGRITGPADIVLVQPTDEHLVLLGLDWVQARVRSETNADVTDPACSLPEAQTAGRARVGGTAYVTDGEVAACYARSGSGTLVVFERNSVRVVIVGSPEPFTNERLAEEGNAALTLALLSRHDRVEWLQPKLSELGQRDDESRAGAIELMPPAVLWGAAQLLVAGLFAIAWRARRLGPVVTEPLPVVVRAAEAVEGRARLYQAASARERAAAVLRTATRLRITRRLGMAPDADRNTVVPAVAARAARHPETVDLLLYGPPPSDDEALVRLAADLDSLDHEVR